MDLQLTTKAHEALAAARARPRPPATPISSPPTCCWRWPSRPTPPPAALLAGRRDLRLGPTAADRPRGAARRCRAPSGRRSAPGPVPRRARGASSSARAAMASMGDTYVSTDHLLLALPAPGPSACDADAIEASIPQLRGGRQGRPPSDPEATVRGPARSTAPTSPQAAREGRLDPVIGRDAEIRRVVQVLSRRTKNNPVLIGEPGVGKTAVVEGLAQRIVAGDVPGVACAASRWSRSTSARWWPARSTAASSRSGSRPCWRRSSGSERPGRHLHRRAAHRRRRRCHRRGRDGRRQHAQADAGPRRAAARRRDHARRVPQAHREGRRPGAAVPAGLRRRADGRGHHRHPARPQGALRGAPQGRPSPTARWSRRPRCPTATSPGASCPTRRSTSSTRPPPGCGWRSTPPRSRSTSSGAPSTG